MSAITRSIKSRKITTFSSQAPDAKAVFLAGSFNGWNPASTPMTKSGSDEWSTDLELVPGSYEYRLVIDGQWCNERECATHEGCPHCVPNPFGTRNQRLQVD